MVGSQWNITNFLCASGSVCFSAGGTSRLTTTPVKIDNFYGTLLQVPCWAALSMPSEWWYMNLWSIRARKFPLAGSMTLSEVEYTRRTLLMLILWNPKLLRDMNRFIQHDYCLPPNFWFIFAITLYRVTRLFPMMSIAVPRKINWVTTPISCSSFFTMSATWTLVSR